MYLTHITTEGERWDQLAHHYYGDPLGYERLIAANPQVPLSPTLPAGLALSVPVIDAAPTTLADEELPPWLR